MSPRGVLNYELWSALSLAQSTKNYELGLGRLCCKVQLWSAFLRDHLGLLYCNAQCSTVIYFSTFELPTSKKYSLITQAFLSDCCLWKEYIFTRPRSVSVNFLLSSQTKMAFASLLEWSLVHLSFSQLHFCQCWLTLNVWVFVPLAMFSFLSMGTWKYDALYLNQREKVSWWLKWNHGVSLRWHSRGRWWVGGLLPRLLPPAMTPAIALHHILRNTRMISASPSSSSSKTVTIIIFD